MIAIGITSHSWARGIGSTTLRMMIDRRRRRDLGARKDRSRLEGRVAAVDHYCGGSRSAAIPATGRGS